MIVQHNMTALNANRQLGITNTNLSRSTEKLSSGWAVTYPDSRRCYERNSFSTSENERACCSG